MSLDDCKRFEEMEGLYSGTGFDEEVNIYSYGFTLGAFRRRQRGTGFYNPAPAAAASFYGKTGSTGAAITASLCGATRPAPPASNKEQNRVYSVP